MKKEHTINIYTGYRECGEQGKEHTHGEVGDPSAGDMIMLPDGG